MKKWRRTLFKQIYRYTRPRSMRHMENAWPYLKIKQEASGARSVSWRGRFLFESPPWERLLEWREKSPKALIVATGPSIKEVDTSRFNEAFVIGVNGAIALQDTQAVAFDAYVVVDPGFIRDRFNLFKRVIEQGIPCFLTFHCIRQACQIDENVLQGANIILVEFLNNRFNKPRLAADAFYRWAQEQEGLRLCSEVSPGNDKVGFSLNPKLGFYDGATVAYWALQIAGNIGFDVIGIAGMDLGDANTAPRFYEREGDIVPSTLLNHYHSSIEPSFRLAVRVLQDRGQKAYNLSLISSLPEEIMPKLKINAFLDLEEVNEPVQHTSL